MKKNGFLTFIFACIPGAGQMYYGYMKRGLSLITVFCLSFALATIFSPVSVLAPIVWMYSFFDTYDLVRRLVSGCPKDDTILLVGDGDDLKNLAINHNKAIGWVLVGLGVWALYSNILEPMLASLLQNVFGMENAWFVLDQLPTVLVAVLLVYFGIRLLAPRGAAAQPAALDETVPYPTNNNM